jgi:sulfite reductase (ferredoxin)
VNEVVPGNGHPPTPERDSKSTRSGVEVTKENSRALRGTIKEVLTREGEVFQDADKNLLKFHGSYQQDNRDARGRQREGLGKQHIFMVRCKIPGGRITAEQYLGLDELTGKYANGTLRVTTRQGIQFHGVLKEGLKKTIAGINATLLTTLGACGDVNRNVMACPCPVHDGIREQLQAVAARLAQHFAPRTSAYHEIWLDGQPTEQSGHDPEPIYGKVYLPRKFKVGLALPEDNCVDVYAQDLGLLAVVESGRLVGFDVLVGGGMGKTHGNASTFPYLAKPICFIDAERVLAVAEGVVKLFRDHGNRADRKRARIKYVVHDWGVERFREVLAGYLGFLPDRPRGVKVTRVDLHLGAHPQGDGKWWYGVSIENGRIKDEGGLRLRSALRTIVERFRPEVRTTPQQDVLLCGLSRAEVTEIETLLSRYGVARPEEISLTQKWSLACPALPTCGLALSEAERALPPIIDQLEAELRRLGLEGEAVSVRMTGCPNGCARPYQSDIGLVGRSGEKYVVYVGGGILGDRLNFELKDLVKRGDIVTLLRPLLERYKAERQVGESFGDYCHRLGEEAVKRLVSAS